MITPYNCNIKHDIRIIMPILDPLKLTKYLFSHPLYTPLDIIYIV